MSAIFNLEGEEEVLAQLQRLIPQYQEATQNAMMDWADDVMNEAKRLCPVDTGALRASGFTEMLTDTDGLAVSMGFTQDYALYVHENLDAFHDVGQAKFLEEPLLLKSNELLSRIMNYIEKEGGK